MPDYDAWDLTNDFTVAQASCLWCEVDQDISFLVQKSRNSRIAAVEQMLVSEIRAGRLRADSTQNVLAAIGDYSESLVTREALKELAEKKGLTPKFLFTSARQLSSEVQASAPLAPREGSASTRDKSTSPLGRSVGQEGEIDFVPSGCIGLPGAVHAIWRAVHGDAMDQPIPFWREEEQDGKTVRIPTPEAAEEHKRLGRTQAGEAEELLLGGLAGGQLVAEVDDPNGTKPFTVPIWYWQSDRANITISTGRLDLPTGSHSQFHLRTCFILREAFHEWLHIIVGGAETEAAPNPLESLPIVKTPQALVPLEDGALDFKLKLDSWTLTEALFILHGCQPPGFENSDELMSHFPDAYHLAGNSIKSGTLCREIQMAGERRYIESPARWFDWALEKDLPIADTVRAKMMRGDSVDEKADAPDPHSSGFPGRPPKAKHLIEQEFRRRVDAGEVCPTLPEEAGALLEWLKGEHPSAPPPTVKTIKNNIRDLYRKYEQMQCPK